MRLWLFSPVQKVFLANFKGSEPLFFNFVLNAHRDVTVGPTPSPPRHAFVTLGLTPPDPTYFMDDPLALPEWHQAATLNISGSDHCFAVTYIFLDLK